MRRPFLSELLGTTSATAGRARHQAWTAWQRLPEVLAQAPEATRQRFFTNLSHWLSEQHPSIEPAVLGQLDALLMHFARHETDLRTLYGVSVSIEARVLELMAAQQMSRACWRCWILLPAVPRRIPRKKCRAFYRPCSTASARTGTCLCFLERMIEQPETMEGMHGIVALLGARAIRPLIAALKEAGVMQERIRLIQLLREFGTIQGEPLVEELRATNPWYVYRNLLQVLAEVGTPSRWGPSPRKSSIVTRACARKRSVRRCGSPGNRPNPI